MGMRGKRGKNKKTKIMWNEEKIAKVEQLSFKMTMKDIADTMNATYGQISALIFKRRKAGLWRGKAVESRNRRATKERYAGCDFECEKCPYSDCLAPDNIAKLGLDLDALHR